MTSSLNIIKWMLAEIKRNGYKSKETNRLPQNASSNVFTSRENKHTERRLIQLELTKKTITIWLKKLLLATIVEGDLKAPFSIATTPRCRGGRYSFPGLLYFTLDPYLIMLSVKQGGIKYHFLSLWYDSTCDWTQVSRTIGEHSNR